MKSFSIAAALVVGTMAALPAHAAITIGTPTPGGNCYPVSCFASDGGSEWQEVYRAGAFGGPLTFDTISFFENPDFSQPGDNMDTGNYSFSFYISNNGVNALSNTGADNLGTFLGSLGTFDVSGHMPATLSFTGNTISYDPVDGDLLLRVVVNGFTVANGYESFFQSDTSGTDVSRYYATGGSPTGTADANGIVTRFDLAGAGAVPEPATWAMMLLGFSAVGAALRRRQREPRVRSYT